MVHSGGTVNEYIFKMPVCNRVEPHPEHGAPLPGGGEWVCFGKGKWWHDPSPEGLNPQEIRLRLAEAILAGGGEVDEGALGLLNLFATWSEHGPDETQQIRDWYAACPDPGLHQYPHAPLNEAVLRDELTEARTERDDYASRLRATDQAWTRLAAERDDLKTELLEAHADLEASRAREQIAQERVAQVLAYIAECQRSADDHRQDLLPGFKQIRAILADEQGEKHTKADIIFADGTHWYWSTHCRHATPENPEGHDACRATEFPGGSVRNPSQCKACGAPCRCECHSDQGEEAA